MKRKNFTIVDNSILQSSQLSISARLLYCILVKYAGTDSFCYPSQLTLSKDMGYSHTRQIRTLLNELTKAELISVKRTGFNRANTYYVVKELKRDRNGNSYHVGKQVPNNEGTPFPSNNTYLKRKDKNDANGIESVDDFLRRKGYRLSKVERFN